MVANLLNLLWFAIVFIQCNANPPNIDYSHNMRVLKLPKNTKVGSIIYRLKGSDADNDILHFGVKGATGNMLLEIVSVGFFEADVYLKSPLEKNQYNFTIFVTDEHETTEVESSIMVCGEYYQLDSLPFIDVQPIFKVIENSAANQTIGYVIAKEKNSSNIPVTFELTGSDNFAIKYVFGPRGASRADILLVKEVDYEKKNLYILNVFALNAWTNESIDTRNIALLQVLIVVVDVQDTPPVFIGLPNAVRISENTKIGTTILKVTAEDGDYGNQHNISYNFESNSPMRDYFALDKFNGNLMLKSDISSIKRNIGTSEPILLKIIATEIVKSKNVQHFVNISSAAEIALVIISTENKKPNFKSQTLIGSIEENSQTMTPIKWEGASIPQVFDDDPGVNGTIVLELEDPSDTFMILPSKGINEITFSIVVKDPSKIDYEKNQDKQFNVVISATDQSTSNPLIEKILCTIRIEDVNDNFPQFSQKSYKSEIFEDSPNGIVVAHIEATDLDSGNFGKIKFTAINGPLANDLHLDEDTGTITLINNNELDREKISEYRMSVEARDDNGHGNRNVTELIIKILDSNDNEPKFYQPRYDAVLNPDRFSFTQPLIVFAVDADEPHTPNSNITYEIISGNYQDKFVINSSSGEIKLKSPLTFERSFPSENIENDKFFPVISLVVRAYDNGIPSQSSLVSVNIHNPDYLNRTVIFFLNKDYKQVVESKYELENALNILTGAKSHIYSIQPKNQHSIVKTWISYPNNSSVDLRKLPSIISYLISHEMLEDEDDVKQVHYMGTDNTTVIWLLATLIIIVLLFLIVLACFWCCCYDGKREKNIKNVKIFKSNNFDNTDSQVLQDDHYNSDKLIRTKRKTEKAQAWSDDNEYQSDGRPSSAPHSQVIYPTHGHRVINSTQSFQQFHSPYQRGRRYYKRVRIDPHYYSDQQLFVVDPNDNNFTMRKVYEDDYVADRYQYYGSRGKKFKKPKTDEFDTRYGYSHKKTIPKKQIEDKSSRKTEILIIKSPPNDNGFQYYDDGLSASQNEMNYDEDDSSLERHKTNRKTRDKREIILKKNSLEMTADDMPGVIREVKEEDISDAIGPSLLKTKENAQVKIESDQITSALNKDYIISLDVKNDESSHLRSQSNVERINQHENAIKLNLDEDHLKSQIQIASGYKKDIENSEKSEDSDSGIGFGKNGKLELKNNNKLEKKSIFTIAYNNVKTRNLNSSGSNDD